jgi:preprotein translocase subunit YajC
VIGTVTNLSPNVVTLQIADGVRVKVVRSYIEEVSAEDVEKLEERTK